MENQACAYRAWMAQLASSSWPVMVFNSSAAASAARLSSSVSVSSNRSRASSHLRRAASMGARSAALTSGRSVQLSAPLFPVTMNHSGCVCCSSKVSTPSSHAMNEYAMQSAGFRGARGACRYVFRRAVLRLAARYWQRAASRVWFRRSHFARLRVGHNFFDDAAARSLAWCVGHGCNFLHQNRAVVKIGWLCAMPGLLSCIPWGVAETRQTKAGSVHVGQRIDNCSQSG
jgi:hypothetical protein